MRATGPDPGLAGDPDLDEAILGEITLLDPGTRADPERLRGLVHPDFLEFGASGRTHTHDSVLRDLPAAPDLDAEVTDIGAVRLAPDVILVTYTLTEPAVTRRSSIWVQDGQKGWRMRFHQGTPVPDSAPAPPPHPGGG